LAEAGGREDLAGNLPPEKRPTYFLGTARERVRSNIMGYFDGLTEAAFNMDPQGRDLFYPWGVRGKGYVLPDARSKQRVRSFLKLYYMISLSSIMAVTVTLGSVYAFALVPVLMLWYVLTVRPLLHGLEVTQERRSVAESHARSAKAHNLGTLWTMLVGSVLFVPVGVWITSEGQWLIGLSSVFFFGRCGIVLASMIKSRRS
jgi:hypothetical protein